MESVIIMSVNQKTPLTRSLPRDPPVGHALILFQLLFFLWHFETGLGFAALAPQLCKKNTADTFCSKIYFFY